MKFWPRLLILAVASFACAAITALTAVFTLQATLPPTDGAYGMTFSETLSDPFVSWVMILYGIIGWILGFPISSALLWKTDLSRSIPVVFIVTVSTAALFGPAFGPLSALPALIFSVYTMVIFWSIARSKVKTSQSVES